MLPARSACLLELARIIDLEIDTDDKNDPSCKHVHNHVRSSETNEHALDGVVIFLILSVAEEVCAIICASLSVVIPQLVLEYKSKRSSQKIDNSYPKRLGAVPQSRSKVRGFQRLGEGLGDQRPESRNLSSEQDWPLGSIQLSSVVVESRPQTEHLENTQIVVKTEYEVTVGYSDTHAM